MANAPLAGMVVPPPRAVRVRRTVGMAAGLAFAFAVLYAGALPCMFARLSHHPCPGCGSTRAVLALLHGDLRSVLTYNPFGPPVALLLGILAGQALTSMLRHGDLRDTAKGRLGTMLKPLVAVLAVLEVTLWIARFCGLFGGPVPV